ncbi:pachytene checkpoint protein 2 homolog isoform X2 [Mauremys mutica]|uniref:Pachytene checkpoint protein 2 homolog n=4 Tax=Testudinoidea TaxID=8486 RepID=A0A9D3XDT1_9SAUR|nr:pachytene checkpoint protein 2 homolog isoform X1 [Chrysemys picta bellii]XP_023961961.1 pachytene checkpoint protein 2 homolog isoform X1 [Chrysemys picta bellii]XP_026512150.1 pachytene checkpoint protein 2 homolog [Terrapene carolina triunguis]XP_032621452.1 pachytene checkpoint protein 2 homolog [Chelonoidis abingdonii]XP_039379327.1 pachytene checkpoint protein 2 homolog [Mauremys reevesii]XP_039379328.1 pachytene checkpoint protein 2 homolog [Mauremys reevesii]XP_039379329.1 pachyten
MNKMDEAAGDLKQALPNVCDSVQIHVEVHQKSNSTSKKEDIRLSVLKLLNRHNIVFGDYTWTEFDDGFLNNNVQSVSIVDTELKLKERQPINLSKCNLSIHIFHLNDEGPSTENLEEENENIVAANHWVLPTVEFHGLWESLVYDTEVKSHLLDYVMTTLLFSDKNVDSNLISWNRVVLLHGPPGTGKTSLCKALAQKLTIRLSYRYRYGQLIEINSHSLFSKWFSESGKLVTKMFQKIQELIDDKDALVFVLIDEVESLTAARSAFRAGTEPSDAIRVVNAVLTQIDQIKRYPNVVILTTSNITEKIDTAFVDRADIKQYIGPPSAAAVFRIYFSCLEELMKRQIIYPRQQLLTLRELEMIGYVENNVSRLSLVLKEIARKSEGLSGRVLRKLPFLAHALYIQCPNVTMAVFLQALSLVVDKQFEERKKLADCF